MGSLVATPGVQERVPNGELVAALARHVAGDWGDLCDEDREANEEALKHGTRLMSVYTSRDGDGFWIITEADRSVTTVLLPEEY